MGGMGGMFDMVGFLSYVQVCMVRMDVQYTRVHVNVNLNSGLENGVLSRMRREMAAYTPCFARLNGSAYTIPQL